MDCKVGCCHTTSYSNKPNSEEYLAGRFLMADTQIEWDNIKEFLYNSPNSVGNKARKLTKFVQETCTPFPWSQSWNTFLLADWVIRFQFSPSIFKFVYTDH